MYKKEILQLTSVSGIEYGKGKKYFDDYKEAMLVAPKKKELLIASR